MPYFPPAPLPGPAERHNRSDATSNAHPLGPPAPTPTGRWHPGAKPNWQTPGTRPPPAPLTPASAFAVVALRRRYRNGHGEHPPRPATAGRPQARRLGPASQHCSAHRACPSGDRAITRASKSSSFSATPSTCEGNSATLGGLGTSLAGGGLKMRSKSIGLILLSPCTLMLHCSTTGAVAISPYLSSYQDNREWNNGCLFHFVPLFHSLYWWGERGTCTVEQSGTIT